MSHAVPVSVCLGVFTFVEYMQLKQLKQEHSESADLHQGESSPGIRSPETDDSRNLTETSLSVEVVKETHFWRSTVGVDQG